MATLISNYDRLYDLVRSFEGELLIKHVDFGAGLKLIICKDNNLIFETIVDHYESMDEASQRALASLKNRGMKI